MSINERLYLDHAAITPVLPETREAVCAALLLQGNPSSPHLDGRQARSALEDARRTIAARLGWPHDVIFTSGATEALEIVASRAGVARRIVLATEHEAVFAAMGATSIILPVHSNGLVDLGALETELALGPAIVAVQLVNNETGVIQPLDAVSQLVKESGSLLISDCAQGAGKIALPEADFISITSQKFGGMPGSGALLVRDLSTLRPSGGQERGYRRGTENLPGVAAMASALATGSFSAAMPRLRTLRDVLEREILASGGTVVAADAPRIATIGAYAMPRVSSSSQLVQFDLAGISVSAGSACSSGSMKASRVLKAMGLPDEVAASVVRVSFGPLTNEADVDRFVTEWRRIRNQAKVRAA